jgi:hypothetical protein
MRRGAWTLLAATFAVSVSAAACARPNVPAGTVEPAGQPTSGPATQATSTTYRVGDRVRIGDDQFFGLLEVDLDVEPSGIAKPGEGKKWIAVLAEIEGIAATGASYNPLFFTVRDSDGFEYAFTLFGKEPSLKSSNDLAPGDKVRGWVTFEVPKSATGLTLRYEAGLLARPVTFELG